jgi:hypothetical protein
MYDYKRTVFITELRMIQIGVLYLFM